MKKVDRDFWTSYLDDTLRYRREPWANFGHLTQVVLAHAAAGIKINPVKPSCSSPRWSTWNIRSAKEGVYDPGVRTEDQRLASPEDWERNSYVPGLHQILQNLHISILSIN